MNLRRFSAKELYFMLLGISSTMYIVGIKGIPLFYFLAVFGILIIGKVSFRIDKSYLLFIVVTLISLLLNITNGYEVTMTLSFMLGSIVCLLGMSLVAEDAAIIESAIRGIKISCIIQIAWCFLQFALYRLVGLDINKLLFEDILHTVTTASRVVEGKLVLTGLCWHPSNMVPVLILSMVLFDRWYVWAACVVVSLGMDSSTAILALLAFVVTVALRSVVQRQLWKKLKSPKMIISIVAVLLLIVLALGLTGIGASIMESIQRLAGRITGTSESLSTSVHRSYYRYLPRIVKESSLLQVLFGYGPSCSGLPITRINGQYSNLGAWVVESDYLNILYSYGIFGFIAYYTWLLKKLLCKSKNHCFYIDFLIPLLVAGITYNVQYYWVVFVIIVFSAFRNSRNGRSRLNEVLQ